MSSRSVVSYLKVTGRIPAGFKHPAILRDPSHAGPLGLFFFFSTEAGRRAAEQDAVTAALKLTSLTKEPVIASIWASATVLETLWIAGANGIQRVREVGNFRFADDEPRACG